jgi:polyphosphate kinase 2 (PPK2 family)
MLVKAGFYILKYYLDISKEEQEVRLKERAENPLKQWKISPIDSEAQQNWKAYSAARNEMLLQTNFKNAPWYIANAEDKTDLHIALISHLLKNAEYKDKDEKLLEKDLGLITEVSGSHTQNHLYE